MACVRKRKKNGEEVYVADWRDALGFRRMKFCKTKNEADAVLADAIKESQQRTRPLVDPNVTVEGYATHWLAMRAPRSDALLRRSSEPPPVHAGLVSVSAVSDRASCASVTASVTLRVWRARLIGFADRIPRIFLSVNCASACSN